MTLVIDLDNELARDPWFSDWLRELGIDPALTFRVEVLDGVVTAHRYKAAADGGVEVANGAAVIDDPQRVPLKVFLPDRIATLAREL